MTALLGAARAAPASEVSTLRWVNRDRQELHELVSRAESLDALWPERVLVVQSNRGFTQGLLGDSPRAAALGLTPESAQFGCLLHFLLEPTAAALAPLAPLRDALADAFAIVGFRRLPCECARHSTCDVDSRTAIASAAFCEAAEPPA